MLKKFYTRIEDADGAAVGSAAVSLLRAGSEITRAVGAGVFAVRDPGALRLNDVCVLLRSGAVVSGSAITVAGAFTYDSANDDWEVDLAGSGTPLVGDRLALTGNSSDHHVDAYTNERRAGTPTNAAITAGTDGVVERWVDARDVDVKIVSGSTTKYLVDIAVDGDARTEVDGDVTTQSLVTTVLWTFTVPAYWMRHGHGFRLLAWGRCTGSAGTKEVRIDFGSTVLATVGVATTNDWRIDATVVGGRSANQQRFTVHGWDGTTAEGFDSAGTATETATSAIVLRVEGEVADAADSLILDGVVFDLLGSD